MANSSVISRKDMKEPDRFQVMANQAASWLAARKRKVALVGAAAVAVVVIVGVAAAVQTSRAEAAGRATAELLDLVGAPILAKPDAGSTARSFPSEEAKQKALVAEADKVLRRYGDGKVGLLAVLVKGDAQLALKEWDAAAAEYQRPSQGGSSSAQRG